MVQTYSINVTVAVEVPATPTPVPLFGELWERLLLSVMVLGFAALGLYMRR